MPDPTGPSGDDWAMPPVHRSGSAPPPAFRPPPPSGPSPSGPPPSGPPPRSAGPAGWGGAPDGWGAAGRGQAPQTTVALGGATGTVGPPTWLLLIGIVIPLATIPALFVDGLAIHIAAWVVAIFGSVGALAVFTAVDLRRRASRWYVDQSGLLAVLRVAVLVVGLAVAGCFAYQIADEVARWDWS